MAVVLLIGSTLQQRLLFAAYSLERIGIPFRLLIKNVAGRTSNTDEQDCLKWWKQSPSIPIEFVDFERLPNLKGSTCLVSVNGNVSDIERAQLRDFVSGFTRRVCLLRFAPDSVSWQIRQLVREVRSPFYKVMTELWTEDVYLLLLRTMLRKPHRFFGALPSQRCSLLVSSWAKLAEPTRCGSRRYLFAYSGSWNIFRDAATSWVEARLVEMEGDRFFELERQGSEPVIWNNDRPGERLERSFEGYIQELESAWFCLCLPGYTGTTNRALEAILRGAIPVLQEDQVPFHGLPLSDGVNAVLVRNGDWPAAISRLLAIPVAERAVMQANVIHLAQSEARLENLMTRFAVDLLRAKELERPVRDEPSNPAFLS